MFKEAWDEVTKESEAKLKEAIDAGEDPKEAANRIFPRWFYMGHKVNKTFPHPDKRAEWECNKCQAIWVSKDGTQCPDCKDCRHVWYDDENGVKTCRDNCGISYEEHKKNESFRSS